LTESRPIEPPVNAAVDVRRRVQSRSRMIRAPSTRARSFANARSRERYLSTPARSLIGDGERGRVVLRLRKVGRLDAPQLARANPRRKRAAQAIAIDQPVGLRVAADDRGGEHDGRAL